MCQKTISVTMKMFDGDRGGGSHPTLNKTWARCSRFPQERGTGGGGWRANPSQHVGTAGWWQFTNRGECDPGPEKNSENFSIPDEARHENEALCQCH